jgi:tripartite-type tricarboxylate transporter receptor subunit TctC
MCSGQLRPLAVTSSVRSEALPEVPTVSEFVPGYEADLTAGIGAPKRTPSDIVDKLNSTINAALANPRLKVRFAELGITPMPMTPTDYGNLIAAETEKWAKVIKFAGIRAE